jgi:hypothetical protein
MAITTIRTFQNYVYETDILAEGEEGAAVSGIVRALTTSVALEIGDFTNTPPSETENTYPNLIRLPGHKKRTGITARAVKLTSILGTAPLQSRIYRIVPIFDPAVFNASLGLLGSNPAITFEDSSNWTIAGMYNEIYGQALTALPSST